MLSVLRCRLKLFRPAEGPKTHSLGLTNIPASEGGKGESAVMGELAKTLRELLSLRSWSIRRGISSIINIEEESYGEGLLNSLPRRSTAPQPGL